MKKCVCILMCFAFLFLLVPKINAVSGENKEIVYFSGNATAEFTTWSDWGTAVSLGNKDFKISDFSQPFYIEVEYQSEMPPILVFLSWTGGNSWAEMKADSIENGKAYYFYDNITENYGSDFSLLNSIRVKPYGKNLTVTKITLLKGEKELEINFCGTAGKIANEINVGWNLGNTLECDGEWISKYTDGSPSDYETAWHNPITTETMIRIVKNAGFNAVRLPVSWYEHMDNNYKIDDKWLDRVQEVVDYIIKNDMYCIINVHHDTGKTGWLKASENGIDETKFKYSEIWKQISEKFENYDNRLLFESFNEILDDENNWSNSDIKTMSIVNELNQLFVDTVRSAGKNNATRCLVVNTYGASASNDIVKNFTIPNDSVQNSIIAEVHCYRPLEYCSRIEENENLQTDWKENDGKDEIDKIFYSLYCNFTSKGIPVFIGEFAVAGKNNDENRAEYAEYYVNSARNYGIKCFWWDNGGKIENDENFGYFTNYTLLDRYNYKWVYPEIVKSLTGVEVSNTGCIGDVDYNAEIEICDATLIQCYLAKYINFDAPTMKISDVNSDGIVNVKDVTKIQMFLVDLN